MTDTPHMGLPLLDSAQAQKHVTHNESLLALDHLVHLSVIERNRVTPPASPGANDRYLVGVAATGDFLGKDKAVATRQDGAWRFFTPQKGWRAFVEAENLLAVFDGTNWMDVAPIPTMLQNMTRLGVGTSADATNPLAAKLNGALFTAKPTAEGGTDAMRFTLNKATTASTVSQLYQSNYSGRAETGLIGDDHFRIKVSPDGSAWNNALDIDPATGVVSFPSGVAGVSGMSYRRRETFTANGTFTKQAGDVAYFVRVVGAGGGGGSGRRSASSVQAGGGAGGNGGYIVEGWVPAALVGATSTVTVGAGGVGGVAAASSTNGAAGGAGGTSYVFDMIAYGGAGGGGGTASSGGAAGSIAPTVYGASIFTSWPGGPGGASANGSGSNNSSGTAGGGGGAGLSAANVEASGAAAGGGAQTQAGGQGGNALGGTPTSPNGGNGTCPGGRFGSGGGGGASKVSAAAGNGGNGATPGGGGGGGGGGRDGQSGGAGGNGGGGMVVIDVFG